MPKINSNASDKQNDAMTTTERLMTNVVISTDPVIITAVQRKVNIGNFETVDLYMAVALPKSDLDLMDKEALTKGLNEAAEYGFNLVGRATGDRYLAMKESLKSR